MFADRLVCVRCGAVFDVQEKIWACKDCGSLLDVKYNYEEVQKGFKKSDLLKKISCLWRYKELLPLQQTKNICSLGEGWTYVQKSSNYGNMFGLKRLFFKLEYLNPTGSFKDRGSTVLVSKAKELQVKSMIDDSSGNAGSSLAAYCARAGIKSFIYVPASAPAGKATQVKMYGAKLVRIDGTREDVARAAREACRVEGRYYGSHNMNPYFLEGNKTFAYEVAEQMGWAVPDHIVFPVGGGTLIVGSWKGFDELMKLGWIEKFPKLHCVQAEACMPIVHAYQRGLDYIEEVEESETIAGGVRIRRPARGEQVLNAVRETGGTALAVPDEELLHHQKVLARREGIFAEPTSCVALAGLAKLCETKEIDHDETVVVPITGFGLKDVETAKKQVGL